MFGIQGRGLRHPEAVLHPQGEPGLRGASTINIELEALIVKETGRVSLENVSNVIFFLLLRNLRSADVVSLCVCLSMCAAHYALKLF